MLVGWLYRSKISITDLRSDSVTKITLQVRVPVYSDTCSHDNIVS